jgi:hypothetical protein
MKASPSSHIGPGEDDGGEQGGKGGDDGKDKDPGRK